MTAKFMPIYLLLILTLFWHLSKSQGPPRPPPVCGRNEVLCPPSRRFCFDRTCSGRSFPALKNGRCTCRTDYLRNQQRQCVCTAKCNPLTPNARCPDDPLDPGPPIRPPPLVPPPPGQKFLDTESEIILYQLYHESKQDHLYTRSNEEVENAQRSYGYKFETAIAAMASKPEDILVPCPRELVVPLFRMYRDGGVEADHFYTTDPEEVNSAGGETPPYKPEGVAGLCISRKNACGASWGLSRFYSNTAINHFYATDNDLQGDPSSMGDYKPEGTECYVWPYSR